jgi:UDP-3-O-[3-hydroxymyristoyl] glucosamine N-acyltransferase
MLISTVRIRDLLMHLNQRAASLDIEVEGDQNLVLQGVGSVLSALPSELSWINPSRKDGAALATSTKAGALIVAKGFSRGSYSGTLLRCNLPDLAFSLSIEILHLEARVSFNPGIHPTAIVDQNAKISKTAYIGPYCYIGAAQIGDGTYLESHVRVYGNASIGKDCMIYSFTSIGGEGFGFVRDETSVPQRMPHIGRVEIGDRVCVMHHTNIDRPTLGVTRIQNDTKIDHYCHIGHNCNVGRANLIAAGTILCGGAKIEDFCFVGARSVINESVAIGSHAFIGSGSVVTKHVPAHAVWAGNPARDVEELKRQLSTLRDLAKSSKG